MAKRKSSMGVQPSPPTRSEHISTSIDGVDNGYIVNISGEGKNGEYYSKRMIAADKPTALRIANEHLSAKPKKGGKKSKGGRKKISLKKN